MIAKYRRYIHNRVNCSQHKVSSTNIVYILERLCDSSLGLFQVDFVDIEILIVM